MRVSISKIATYAQPMHNKFFEILTSHCADLNGAEQLTTLLMILTVVRETAIKEYGEEVVKEIEEKLKEIKSEGEDQYGN